MLITLVLILIGLVAIAMFIVSKIELLDRDWIRFILTGGFNTFNYYIAYLLLIPHHEYLVAHISAFLYSGLCSYFVTTLYTFKEQVSVRKFCLFPITFLPNLIISTVMTYVFVSTNLISETFASLIAMFLAIPITFFVSKLVVTGQVKN